MYICICFIITYSLIQPIYSLIQAIYKAERHSKSRVKGAKRTEMDKINKDFTQAKQNYEAIMKKIHKHSQVSFSPGSKLSSQHS